MQNILKFSILVVTTVSLICCNNDDGNGIDYPYYEFDETDTELLINYEYDIGEIITYENQNGEQLNFKVIFNETSKVGEYSLGTFSGGGGLLQSYYDSKIVRLEIIENQDYGREGLVNYIFSNSQNLFKIGVNFPLWNISSAAFIDELDNRSNIFPTDLASEPLTQMIVNGHLFERTIAIDSESEDINEISSYGTLISNVNKLYYDYDFGIIQFDDMEGNEWKLNLKQKT